MKQLRLYFARRIVSTLALVALASLTQVAIADAADPLDWTNWRGPEQNGTSRETGLIDKWDPDSGENLLWKNEALATISTPIVMNGKLYVLCRSEPGTHREGEKVVCADAATGEVLWQNVTGALSESARQLGMRDLLCLPADAGLAA